MVKFILNLVNIEPNHYTDGNTVINKEYPLVEKEYLKYIRHYKKSKGNVMDTYQFVSADTYAAYLFKEINSESISKDYEGTYIINLYVCKSVGNKLYCDYKTTTKCFRDIVEKIRCEFQDNYNVFIYNDEIMKWHKDFITEQVNKIFHKTLNIISE